MTPAFRFVTGVVLCSCALVSACLFVFFGLRGKEGTIRLREDEGDVLLNGGTDSDDPFDVTTPEDVIDGQPIDEEAFWSKVCHRYFGYPPKIMSKLQLGPLSKGCAAHNHRGPDSRSSCRSCGGYHGESGRERYSEQRSSYGLPILSLSIAGIFLPTLREALAWTDGHPFIGAVNHCLTSARDCCYPPAAKCSRRAFASWLVRLARTLALSVLVVREP